jgi:DNA-directed RNA polymerase specialized sigma24 family protein
MASAEENNRADEIHWLEQALHGDADSFMHLIELYQKPVFNLCYRMLGNREDAEDAAQETFLRAYSHLKKYDLATLHCSPSLHRSIAEKSN